MSDLNASSEWPAVCWETWRAPGTGWKSPPHVNTCTDHCSQCGNSVLLKSWPAKCIQKCCSCSPEHLIHSHLVGLEKTACCFCWFFVSQAEHWVVFKLNLSSRHQSPPKCLRFICAWTCEPRLHRQPWQVITSYSLEPIMQHNYFRRLWRKHLCHYVHTDQPLIESASSYSLETSSGVFTTCFLLPSVHRVKRRFPAVKSVRACTGCWICAYMQHK